MPRTHREQSFLLPPSLLEWAPEDHLVWTVLGAVDELDLSPIYGVYRPDGHDRPAYERRVMACCCTRMRAGLALVEDAIAHGMTPADVSFEITETAAMTNLAAARAFAGTLAELGCTVALDDFGTGFGSFSYLKHIPVRYLKIDIEFVRELATDETDQQVVKAIVGIAHSLNKLTIAEGVEDAKTLDLLRAYEVDYAQGFHLGRPEPLAAPAAPGPSSSKPLSRPEAQTSHGATLAGPPIVTDGVYATLPTDRELFDYDDREPHRTWAVPKPRP